MSPQLPINRFPSCYHSTHPVLYSSMCLIMFISVECIAVLAWYKSCVLYILQGVIQQHSHWWNNKSFLLTYFQNQQMYDHIYPSMISESYSAGLSQTGQSHVGFFSFICRYVAASKHCRCWQELDRHGTVIRTLLSCNTSQISCKHHELHYSGLLPCMAVVASVTTRCWWTQEDIIDLLA